ncbi:MAG: TIR domain-containing protein [Clostridia bacterium]|nr:TIR domain-containing protein [Clostridia bacterium]
MAVFKCKMCGGTLEINGETVATCDYCGSVQTVPKKSDDIIANLFNRANNLRIKCEFDKAAEVYEKIVNEDNTEAEAYWGLVLCKYGIEYVEDPKTYKRIPTCHRTQYESILSDVDYQATISNADSVSLGVYKSQAEEIAALQKDILAIVKSEKPFDVFICYKETDENGKRTVDSALANDIYYQLTQEGLKVFYAAITLEDKLGVEYEPYIFAALNSAKVMLVVGTKPEYFDAVWVKNEWSRYLKLMKADRSKLLIPCYRDMDAYDLPEEFSHLQAQDMSKIGFVNDVVRGIKKIIKPDEPKSAPVVQQVTVNETSGGANTASLLKRAFMFLEDGDWNSANEYCEKVLDIDPENAEAYLGKLMAYNRAKTQIELKDCARPFDDNNNYRKIVRFGDEALVSELEGYIKYIKDRNEIDRIRGIYESACKVFAGNPSEESDIIKYEKAIKEFRSIKDWRDSEEKIQLCQKKIESIKEKAKAERIERERQAELARIAEKKRRDRPKKIAAAIVALVVVIVTIVVINFTVIVPSSKYKEALKLVENKEYIRAVEIFEEIPKYKDSALKASELNYDLAVEYAKNKDYTNSAIRYGKAGDYKDAREKSFELWDKIAVRETIATSDYHTVGLKSDGTVVTTIDSYDREDRDKVGDWTDIIAVAAGANYTVGLKSDGTVVTTPKGDKDMSKWTDIVAISAGSNHTVGLKSDGTVVAVGKNKNDQCEVDDWTDIVAISTGSNHTVGLKSNGTVVAAGAGNYNGECDVSDWTDIVAISASSTHTVGLKSDGTVVAVGNNSHGQCDVNDWKNIVAVSAGKGYTVGLKSNGTVVAVGNDDGRCDVSGWKNITAIIAGDDYTVGLKNNGTVVATKKISEAGDGGKREVSDWKDIKQP